VKETEIRKKEKFEWRFRLFLCREMPGDAIYKLHFFLLPKPEVKNFRTLKTKKHPNQSKRFLKKCEKIDTLNHLSSKIAVL